MAYFPTTPTDGQTVTVNGILYTYNATKGAWKRVVSTLGNLEVAGNITAANINVTGTIFGNITASNVTATSNSSANKFYVTEGIFWSNGTAFASTTYSNANVASYLLAGAVIGEGSSNLVVAATTQSESVTTGALVVKGGAGIAGNLYVGGNLTVANVSYEYREVITTTETVQGNIVAAAGTASTNTTTGALVVVGGAGISGALNIGTTGDVSANIGTLFLGNASTQANLGSFQTYTNANAATQATSINTINANLGAYQLYANANIGTLFLGNASTQANLGAFQTYSNANIGTLFLGNASTQANLGAYQIYANANAASQATSINTINANLGSFETYANTKIGTNTNSNLVVVSTTPSTDTTTGALVVGGGVGIAGNIHGDKFYTVNGIFWSGNGAAYSSGSGGGGGGSFTASATAPGSPTLGSFWYKTTTDVLYEYINDGTTDYWVDIQTQTIASNTASLYAGDVFGGNITFSGTITGSVGYLLERANIVASTPPAVTNLDLITAPILYFTSNSNQNITANIRGNSTISLNSLLSIGQSSTFVIFVPNATAYYVNTIKVDDVSITPYWQGGTAIANGNANSIDIYTFAVLKTADATFKVFASQVKYQNLGP